MGCLLLPLVTLVALQKLPRADTPAARWTPNRTHRCAAVVEALAPCRLDRARSAEAPHFWCSPGSSVDEAWVVQFVVRSVNKVANDCRFDVRVFDDRQWMPAAYDNAQLEKLRQIPGLACAEDGAVRRCVVPVNPYQRVSVAVLLAEPSPELVAEVVHLKVLRQDGLNVRRSALVEVGVQLFGFASAMGFAVALFQRTLARDRRLFGTSRAVTVLAASGVMASGLWVEFMPVDLGGFDERRPWRSLYKLPLWWLPFGAALIAFLVACRSLWSRLGPASRPLLLVVVTVLIAIVGPVIQLLTSDWKIPGQHPVFTSRFGYYATYGVSLVVPLVVLAHGDSADSAAVHRPVRAALHHAALVLSNLVAVLGVTWLTSSWVFAPHRDGWPNFMKPLTMVGNTLLALPSVLGITLALAWQRATPEWLAACDRRLSSLLDEVDLAQRPKKLRQLLVELLGVEGELAALPWRRRLALGHFCPPLIRGFRACEADVLQFAAKHGEPPTTLLARFERLAAALDLPRKSGAELDVASVTWRTHCAGEVTVTATLVPDPAYQADAGSVWVWDRGLPASPRLRARVDALVRRLLVDEPRLASALEGRLRAKHRLVVSFTGSSARAAQHDLGYELPLALALLLLVEARPARGDLRARGRLSAADPATDPGVPLKWQGDVWRGLGEERVAIRDRRQARDICTESRRSRY